MKQFSIHTTSHVDMIDITGHVRNSVRESRISSGICYVFIPHTTAAVTINENADPDVRTDIIKTLDRLVPLKDSYRHAEGNSAAHIKSSLLGSSQTLFVENGDLILGTWQSIFLCEFDGPRTRDVFVKLIPADM